jgi:hypothetical protein
VTLAVLPRRLDVTVEERTLRILSNIETYEKTRDERERRSENREKAYQEGMTRVLAEIKEVREEVRHEVRGVQARVEVLEGGARLQMTSTPPSGYSSGGWDLDLPASKSGKVSEEDVKRAWAGKLVQLDEEVRTLRAEKEAAEKLREDQAKEAAEYRKQWLFRIKIAGAIFTLSLPTLSYIATKVFHL